jgi:hypothetical protein
VSRARSLDAPPRQTFCAACVEDADILELTEMDDGRLFWLCGPCRNGFGDEWTMFAAIDGESR